MNFYNTLLKSCVLKFLTWKIKDGNRLFKGRTSRRVGTRTLQEVKGSLVNSEEAFRSGQGVSLSGLGQHGETALLQGAAQLAFCHMAGCRARTGRKERKALVSEVQGSPQGRG